jgi:hypothetical protein
LSIGVQLFTVPTVAYTLVKENEMLDVVVRIFHEKLMQAQLPEYGILDLKHEIFHDLSYWKPYADVRYVLGNLCVSQYILYHNIELFSKVTMETRWK